MAWCSSKRLLVGKPDTEAQIMGVFVSFLLLLHVDPSVFVVVVPILMTALQGRAVEAYGPQLRRYAIRCCCKSEALVDIQRKVALSILVLMCVQYSSL